MTHRTDRMPSTTSFQRVILMGFGNIGQALVPLLRQTWPGTPLEIVDERMDASQQAVAERHALPWRRLRITADNYRQVLAPSVCEGTLLLNLATSIGSEDVLTWAQQQGAFYLDTCIDPWSYDDGALEGAHNTNYAMREALLARCRELPAGLPTAVVAHGANPGLVSVLVKEGLVRMADQAGLGPVAPASPVEWALLAEQLGVRVIQVAERDTQSDGQPRAAGEFVNTWSVDGFVAEALQPVELGWGSHEAQGPLARLARHHEEGGRSAVYFQRLGHEVSVRSWCPAAGSFTGRLISHNEAMSISAFLTVPGQGGELAAPRYRPTVYYAYHPSDVAMDSLALLATGDRSQVQSQRVMKDEIVSGIDELGVFLLSDRLPALWLGSQLDIQRAREMAPHNNATSLQVVGSVMAALKWMLRHPRRGMVESEALDHDFLLQEARPYWEPLVCVSVHWHPATGLQTQGQAGTGSAGAWCLDQFWEGAPAGSLA